MAHRRQVGIRFEAVDVVEAKPAEEAAASEVVAAVSVNELVEQMNELAEPAGSFTLEVDTPEWPLHVSPKRYLARWPRGRRAALARAMLGLPEEESQ